MGRRSVAAIWTLVVVALVSQAVALLGFGQRDYLCIQGTEALAASALLLALGVRYRRRDPRRSRWPPLLPLAAIAVAGGTKDLYVALNAPTPTWLIVLLLAAVAWFLGASWAVWRSENDSPPT